MFLIDNVLLPMRSIIHVADSMSSIIGTKSITIGSVDDDRNSAMDKQRNETLADYVRRIRLEKDLSLLDVYRQSGRRIAGSYVSRIENGLAKNPSPEKLVALAKGLGVSEDELFAIARGKSLTDEEFEKSDFALVHAKVSKFTTQQKRDFNIAWEMAKGVVERLEREGKK